MYVCVSTLSPPTEARFHVALPWNRATKVCSNSPGHMTIMASMAIYGKKT